MSQGIEIPLHQIGDSHWASRQPSDAEPVSLEHLPFQERIIVVSGPSGVGKGTILGSILAETQSAENKFGLPEIRLARSSTTRERRPGEDADYYDFVDKEEFYRRVQAGYFLEWVEFADVLYGSPDPEEAIKETTGLLVYELDVVGVKTIKQKYPGARVLAIVADSHEVIRKRLEGRGTEDPEKVQKRFDTWMKRERHAYIEEGIDAHFIVNRNIDQAVTEGSEFIRGVYYSCRANAELARGLANHPPRALLEV